MRVPWQAAAPTGATSVDCSGPQWTSVDCSVHFNYRAWRCLVQATHPCHAYYGAPPEWSLAAILCNTPSSSRYTPPSRLSGRNAIGAEESPPGMQRCSCSVRPAGSALANVSELQRARLRGA